MLPPPRATPYRIATVCLGNICRSPIAAVVLAKRIADAGLADPSTGSGQRPSTGSGGPLVEVTSAGTGDWHVGEPMDPRAAAVLTAAGLDPSAHRARQFGTDWLDRDLLLAMDAQNLSDVLALTPPADRDRVRMFRSFDPEGGPDAEVPDPWYGGPDGFDLVLAMVERTCRVLVAELDALLRPSSAG